ncbi:phage holin family protein [Actinomadura sp. NPDC049753]
MGELVEQTNEQIPGCCETKMQLAVAEMKRKGRHAGIGAGLFGGPALVAL